MLRTVMTRIVMSRLLQLLASLLLVGVILSPAYGQEVITLRSGNGAIGSTDSNISFFTRGDGTIAPFSAADFDSARNGAKAVIVVVPHVWAGGLPADPAAQWICVDANKSPQSALYAYDFQVNSAQISSASLDLYFKVDNELGDPSNPGLYINGTAITGTNYLGGFDQPYEFQTTGIGPLLHTGTNTLYFYQYDQGVIAGSLFSATITIQGTAAPAAPTSLAATAGAGVVSLSWTAPAADSTHGAAATYNIKRSSTAGGEVTIKTGVTGTGYADSTVANGTTYYYKVSAVNSAGEGPDSNEASATPIAPPAAPTNLLVSPGDARVALFWTAPAADSAHGAATTYNIKRSSTAGAEVSIKTGVTGTTYTDSAVANGTTYYYLVSASNSAGESPPSDEASAEPLPLVQHTFTGTGWHLISSPYTFNLSISAMSVMAFAFDIAGQNYVVTPTPPADTFHIGAGYWTYVRGLSLTISAGGLPVDSSQPQSITLGQGWNLVGNPFTLLVTLSNIQVANSSGSVPYTVALANHTVSPLFVYNSASQSYQLLQSGSDILNPWDAAWIYSKQSGTRLVFDGLPPR